MLENPPEPESRSPADERVLMDRARGGDRDALEELLLRHAPALRRQIESGFSRGTMALLSADDILQETWLDAFLRIGEFDSTRAGSFAAWLRTIARRKACDAIRRFRAAKRGGAMRPDGRSVQAVALESLLDHLSSGGTRSRPSQVLIREDAKQALNQLIDRLPLEYRRLVRLDLEGASSESIAAEFGKNVGAVYTMRNRAYNELRTLIQACPGGFSSFLVRPAGRMRS